MPHTQRPPQPPDRFSLSTHTHTPTHLVPAVSIGEVAYVQDHIHMLPVHLLLYHLDGLGSPVGQHEAVGKGRGVSMRSFVMQHEVHKLL